MHKHIYVYIYAYDRTFINKKLEDIFKIMQSAINKYTVKQREC